MISKRHFLVLMIALLSFTILASISPTFCVKKPTPGTDSARTLGESILLAPISATNIVGTQHTVTATVQDNLGNPIGGRDVDFGLVSGPNAIFPAQTATTDTNGEATFTYTGVYIGTDIIQASFVNSQGDTVTSNQVTKEWTPIDQVIPEVPLGTVATSAAMIIALVAYATRSKWRSKQDFSL